MKHLTDSDLGRRLAACRILAGFDQSAVAKAASDAEVRGLAASTISKIERGWQAPSPTTVRWLCDLYGVEWILVTDPEYEAFKITTIEKRVEELTKAVANLTAPK